MLNILEAFDLGRLGWDSLDTLHILSEAQQIAFADRNRYLGDADWVDVPRTALLSKEFAAKRRALIHPFQAAQVPVPYGSVEGESTTHFSVVDAQPQHGGGHLDN